MFNNKTFVLEEVANGQLAFAMAHGSPPIDAGENIKLYCMHLQLPNHGNNNYEGQPLIVHLSE